MNVNDLMIQDVKTCMHGASLDEVARLMWDNDCGAIPVVSEDNRPLGIITDRDIAMCAMHRHRPLWEITAGELIQDQRLCCCHQGDSIENCLAKMEQNEVRRILVTRDDGTLAGIISMGDIVAFTANNRGKGQERIAPDNALDMLKHVSGHHAGQQQGGQTLH